MLIPLVDLTHIYIEGKLSHISSSTVAISFITGNHTLSN